MSPGYESDDGASIEDVVDIFPGAVNIANLLRTVAWFVVVAFVLGAAGVGALVGGQSDAVGALGGAIIGTAVGALVGALYASGTFSLAYILLLLNEIEQNTRVTASGNTLTE